MNDLLLIVAFALALALPLTFAFPLPLPLSLALAFAVASLVLRRGIDDRRHRNGEQQRAAADDSLQESATGRVDPVEELLFAHVAILLS
jgi:hypothetical protein